MTVTNTTNSDIHCTILKTLRAIRKFNEDLTLATSETKANILTNRCRLQRSRIL